MFFFFQAEDGIRDADVTGVQTCALPICASRPGNRYRRTLRSRRLGIANEIPGDLYLQKHKCPWMGYSVAFGLALHQTSDPGQSDRHPRGRVDRKSVV